MDTYAQLAQNIIRAQQAIVGPIAVEQAKRVTGLKIGNIDTDIKIEGDKKAVLEELVLQYKGLFGMASIEVCKNAIRGIAGSMPKDQLPQVLAQ